MVDQCASPVDLEIQVRLKNPEGNAGGLLI
jgi:hypothetical protein